MPEEIVEQTVVQEEPQAIQQGAVQEEQPAEENLEDERLEEERRLAEAAQAAEQAKNRRMASLLTMLLLFCLVAEVALASYVGLTLYRNSQENKILAAQYEAYLEQQAQARENPPKVQYIGPNWRVVDGVLTENTSNTNRPQVPQGA